MAKGLQSVKLLVNWGPFDEKIFEKSMRKTERGTFGIFHPFCRKTPKKLIEGDNFFSKNVPQCRKEALQSRPVLYVMRKKRKNLFGSVPWANRGTFWRHIKIL